MSETRFLEALAERPDSPSYDLLPEEQRASYEEMLSARDAMRSSAIDPESLARLESRIQRRVLAGGERRRMPLLGWLTAAAAALLLFLPVFPWNESGDAGTSSLDAPPADPPPGKQLPDPNEGPQADPEKKPTEKPEEEPKDKVEEWLEEELEKPEKPDAIMEIVIESECFPTEKKSPNKKKRDPRAELEAGITETEIDSVTVKLADAAAAATKKVSAELGKSLAALRALKKESIVVVSGEFDRVESVLARYRVPHVVVSRAELAKADLRSVRAVLVNCGRRPMPTTRKALVPKMKQFVTDGGWLVTSDWGVAPYVTEAFPDAVTQVESKKRQPSLLARVTLPQETSPLLKGVFAQSKTEWWFEEAGMFVQPKSGKGRVLVVSDPLLLRFGSGTVAFTCRIGKGAVMHTMAHFDQAPHQKRVGPVVAMDRFVLNTILAASKR
ncbi:MAG: hypothetical protein ACYTGZ_20445 [Planctomycetota bacterium]